MQSQDSTNTKVVNNRNLFSIGLITGFKIAYIDEWSVGMSLAGIFNQNVGPYGDVKYSSYKEYTKDGDVYLTSSILWHIGISIAINRFIRPYISFGVRHTQLTFYDIANPAASNNLNAAIGFNIGSAKSVVGIQGGIEMDSFESNYAINGVVGITINFW